MMTDLINLIPDTVFLMATIFSGMSKGSSDTQSGKLTFKKLVEGSGICFVEDAKGITISSISAADAAIDPFEIGYGTGTGLTSSNFCVSTTTGAIGLFGFGSIRGMTSSVSSCVVNSCNSLIMGGQQNSIIEARTSVILGGNANKIQNCGASIIVGGINNSIYATSSSIISSVSSQINTGSDRSSFISSKESKSKIMQYSFAISSYSDDIKGGADATGVSSKMFGSISSGYNSHNPTENTLKYSSDVANNAIISGVFNCFCFPESKSIIAQGTIISSDCSTIRANKNPKNSTVECSRSATIISSFKSVNSGYFSSVISSCGSCNTYSFKGQVGGFNTIISSCKSQVNQTQFSSLISTVYSYSPNSKSAHASVIGSYYSRARCSIVTVIGGSKNDAKSVNTSIIGSVNSKNEYGRSIMIGTYFSCRCYFDNLITNFYFTTTEGFVPNLFLGGSQNESHFISISGQKNIGKGNSIIIGGYKNYSGKTSQKSLNKTYYCERRYGEQRSAIIGGRYNCLSASNGSIIVGGFCNKELNTVNSSIVGGKYNCIYANGCYQKYCAYYGGKAYYSPKLKNTVENSFIFGGWSNCFQGPTNILMSFNSSGPYQIRNSGIIGGLKNVICGITNPYYSRNYSCPGLTSSVIIGAEGQVNCRSFNLLTSRLHVRGTIKSCKGPTLATLCAGVSGTFTNPSTIVVLNGLVTSVT
jgi:hypothetical protein